MPAGSCNDLAQYLDNDIVKYHEHNDKSSLVLGIRIKHKHDVCFVDSFLSLFLRQPCLPSSTVPTTSVAPPTTSTAPDAEITDYSSCMRVYNRCLDAAQPKNGGPADFSQCTNNCSSWQRLRSRRLNKRFGSIRM
ncbi:uncharacterized protein JCM10292_005383 [Rhodotorula paludigena]|uniref:uncharacterized protein n=1 Tax=Rhodotorula paludigena TaxID=86838 RepID=UPI00316CACAD